MMQPAVELPGIESADLPLVYQLQPAPDVEQLFLRLAGKPHCLFLDSALRDPTLGRYSFLAADPFAFLRLPVAGPPALDALAARLAPYSSPTISELPPFQGGAAGLFSYDLARQLERLPAPRYNEFDVPALAVGVYDVVIAIDHATDRIWIVSQGWPELEPAARRRRAANRLREVQGWLSEPLPALRGVPEARDCVALDELAPHFAVPGSPGLLSNFSEAQYLDVIRRAVEYIRAGDVFQVNLAQRLLSPAVDDPVSLYLRLRRRNAATFAGFFDLGDFQIASASPERFLQVRGRDVETRPIKGTRRRLASPVADLFVGDELRASAKDRAENVMIVDLLRNDLSRVCTPESVYVPELCKVEAYEFVQHLVSVVRGRLRDG
ncbi:MAG: anthranilate synthase component I family protein, partial [Pirellulales bacterium]